MSTLTASAAGLVAGQRVRTKIHMEMNPFHPHRVWEPGATATVADPDWAPGHVFVWFDDPLLGTAMDVADLEIADEVWSDAQRAVLARLADHGARMRTLRSILGEAAECRPSAVMDVLGKMGLVSRSFPKRSQWPSNELYRLTPAGRQVAAAL